MSDKPYDLCVIGGGINGAGIARDAAGRGLSVILIEQGDLGGATSSASTKLIHGGLRYLEHFQFNLVRHSLIERETLLGMAPHLISPLEFILPHDKGIRPAWLIRLGLFLYDHLGKRDKLPASRAVSLEDSPLENHYRKGFSYADCWVDDSRLVVLNALSAAELGAEIRTRTKCVGLEPDADNNRWTVHLDRGAPVMANQIVNAAGPWVRELLDATGLSDEAMPKVRLVKGSHIIVKRQYEGKEAYILQQPDKRIVFAIPYERDFTLIGTTDVDYAGDPAKALADKDEIAYLCAAWNRSFKNDITPADVLWTYSGVRPLIDEGGDNASETTRGYKLILDHTHGPAMLSVFGGKITTYRYLAEEAMNHLCGMDGWTADKALPGGNIPDFTKFLDDQRKRYPKISPALVERCARAYGTYMDRFLTAPLGPDFGGGLHEAEIRYLIENEWAQTAEDILWRRTKIGLHTESKTEANLELYLKDFFSERHDEQNLAGH